MRINIHAFKNCNSLKLIDFSKCGEPVFIGFTNEDNVPNDLSIIIPDKLYDQWLECELPRSHKNLVKYSDKIQAKINKLKNSKILQAYYHLTKSVDIIKNITLKTLLNNIAKKLYNEYNINKEDYSYFEYLQAKKEKIKNGKEI